MSEKIDARSTSTDAAIGGAAGIAGGGGGGGPKAIIKNVDMSEEMQQESVDVASAALDKYTIEKDIAAQIKKEFDKRHGATWHVVVGKNFGSYVTHGTPLYNILIYRFHKKLTFWLCRDEAFHLLLHRLSRYSHLEVIIRLMNPRMDGDEVREEHEDDGG
jgi:dynein light chain LC8-type